MKKEESNLFDDRQPDFSLVREIEQTESILAELFRAELSTDAADAVKQKVCHRLAIRRRRKLWLQLAAAACAVITTLAALVYFAGSMERSGRFVAGTGGKTGIVWAENDAAILAIIHELETIVDELDTDGLQWEHTESAHSRLVSAVAEMEQAAADVDFWKG